MHHLSTHPHLVFPVSINYGQGSYKDIHYTGVSIVHQHDQVVEVLVGITYR